MIDSYTKTPRPLRHVDVDYVVDQTKCAECKDKPCLESCPIDAIYIDETDGLIKLKTTCFGCVLCRNACPFDAISLDVNMDPPLKENVPNINAKLCKAFGACVQACRWNYEIREINKDQYYPIEEDSHGSYILNSKDMCMIDHLDKLQEAGIASIKIEGRMKTEYYVANIINAYRKALDYLKDNKEYNLPEEIRNEVFKSSHRDYSEGFYFGNPKQSLDSSLPISTHDFIAVVLEDSENGLAKVQMRNKFSLNEELELLSKTKNNAIIKIEKIINEEGEEQEVCNVPKQVVFIKTAVPLKKLEILRRKK